MGDKFILITEKLDFAELAKLGFGMGCVQCVANLTVVVVTGAVTVGCAALKQAIETHKKEKEAKKEAVKKD